jgi:hypothetical protein
LIEGTVYKFVDFRIMPDFGEGKTVLQDAWADLKYFPQTALRGRQVQDAVRHRAPALGHGVELRRTRAHRRTWCPNRDLGFELHNSPDQVWNYSLAVLNGVVDGGNTNGDLGDQKDFRRESLRQPWFNSDSKTWKGFGAGLAATYGQRERQPVLTNLRSTGRPAAACSSLCGSERDHGALATEAGGHTLSRVSASVLVHGPARHHGRLRARDPGSEARSRGSPDAREHRQPSVADQRVLRANGEAKQL